MSGLYVPRKKEMRDEHKQLRQRLLEAVPVGWTAHLETRPFGSRRRADVLAQTGTCVVALEAQAVDIDVGVRSDDYLKVGVWPLWVFISVSANRLRSQPLLTADYDIPLVPRVLKELSRLSLPPERTWVSARPLLRQAIAAAREEQL